MRCASFALLVFASLASFAADDPRNAVLGEWHGTSICIPGVRAACRDEVVVYHIRAAAKPDVVTVAANKVVEGKELEMGEIDFVVDFKDHSMVGEFKNERGSSTWTFTFTDREMTGTAFVTPPGKIGRNISLKR